MSNCRHPLNRSITIACIIFLALINIVLAISTYRIYTSSMFSKYQLQMRSVVDYIQSHIDIEDMSECSETFVESEKYKEFQEFMDGFVDTYTNIHYAYIIKVMDEDDPVQIREICAGNTTYEKENEPDNVLHLGDGEEGWYDRETAGQFRRIQEGSEDVFILNTSEWGDDYTLARPLIDAQGKHFGILCVDVSVDEVSKDAMGSVRFNLAIIAIAGAVFIVALLLWIRLTVTNPIHKLETSVVEFANSSHGKRDPKELHFSPPVINTQNEIASLNSAITKLADDMKDYVNNIVAVESEARHLQEHVSEMRDIIYHDSLTHVGNRAAYDEMLQTLGQSLEKESVEFAIVMVDINYLKMINDEFGHEHGNTYIIGSCKIILDIYCNSPVYRIGGDEFVAVLQGEDYKEREQLLQKIRRWYHESSLNLGLEPWNRYSAAVGMAVYDPSKDKDVEAVFVRADQEMYRQKAEMKAARI